MTDPDPVTYEDQQCYEDDFQSAEEGGLCREEPAESVAQCGQNPAQVKVDPCDIGGLTIKDNDSKSSVTCTMPAALDTSLSAKEKELLDCGDLLLEVICDQEKAPKAKRAHLKPDISGKMRSGPCGDHPKVSFSGHGISKSNKKQLTISDEIYSKEREPIMGGWFTDFWDTSDDILTYDVLGESCGVHPPDTAYQQLTGKVNVYRPNKTEIKITIPPLATIKKMKSETFKLGGTHEQSSSSSWSVAHINGSESQSSSSSSNGVWSETQSSSSNLFGPQSTQSSTQGAREAGFSDYWSDLNRGNTPSNINYSQNPNGLVGVDSNSSSSQMQSYPMAGIMGRTATPNEVTGEDDVKYKLNPGISVTHNGVEIDITDRINKILDLAATIKATWDEIQNFVPQIGWKFTLDIAVMEGSIVGSYGREIDTSIKSKRIVATTFAYAIDFNMKILEVKVSLSLGIDIGNCLAGAKAKITGSASLGLSVNGTLSNNGKKEIEGVGNVTVGIVGELEVCGLFICGGYRAEVKMPFDLSGKVDGSVGAKPGIHLKLVRQRADLVISKVKRNNVKQMRGSPINLYAEKELWHKQVPEPATPAPGASGGGSGGGGGGSW